MEEPKIENMEVVENITVNNKPSNQPIAVAIIIAGLVIAGAILIKDSGTPSVVGTNGKKLLTSAKEFNKCLDSGKYAQAVTDAKNEGATAGVNGTPKGFIVVGGQVVNTINGAEPAANVKQKLDDALAGKSKPIANTKLAPVSPTDFTLGSPDAKVSLVEYADFQCPFCGRFFKDAEQTVINDYIKNNQISFTYRDFAFLGPESMQSAQAARCAGEQGKFWEYHDYLFSHQNGENQGNFGDAYLKSFAGELKLK